MAATLQDDRQFHLRKPLEIPSKDISTTNHDLLQEHDIINSSIFKNAIDNYRSQDEKTFVLRWESNTGKFILFLQNLKKDIGLVKKVAFERWASSILEAVLKLIASLSDLSIVMFQTIKSFCNKNRGSEAMSNVLPNSTFGKTLETLEPIVVDFKKLCCKVISSFTSKMELDLGVDTNESIESKMLPNGVDRVSAASFRELLIHNEIYNRSGKKFSNFAHDTESFGVSH